MATNIQLLKDFISAIEPMAEIDLDKFAILWKPISAKRKEILTQSGSLERYLYFVTSGVQRVYYQDDKGREATLVFTYAPSFGGVLDAMLEQRRATYWYETITASTFLRASYVDILELKKSCPAIAQFISSALSATVTGLLTRMTELQCFSAEERFRSLLTRSPHVLQQVPHKYLANYLGMDATNFSKFINRIPI